MRFQTKLLIFLITETLLSTLAILLLFEHFSYQIILREMREKVLTIAATSATQINGNLHLQINSRNDENSEAYKTIKHQLKAIRDANRREGTYVEYLYTILPSSEDPSLLVFGIDPEESLSNVSHLGDVIHNEVEKNWSLEATEVSDKLVLDQWGTWLSAHAPIKDSKGNVVAALVVDIPERRIAEEYSIISTKNILAVGIGIIISLISALVIAKRVTNPLKDIHSAVERVKSGNFDISLKKRNTFEFDKVGEALQSMAKGLKERDMVKSAFARYVSHQVVDSILAAGEAPILHGERRRITVLFCDIKGFTSMSEQLRPETVVSILNEFFEQMVDIIFKHGGTLDKFLGDGLMAIFGAPAEDQYQEENAIKAALEIKKALLELSARLNKEHSINFGVGIGINSGAAIVGNIGSSQRMEYTAIGDTVNLASRLESKTRELGADILISEDTYNAVRGAFPDKLKKVGSINVKGKEDVVTAYMVKEIS